MRDGLFPFAVVNLACCLTFNIAFLVIGIVLYRGSTSQFGEVIKQETTEWSRGPIVDITSVASGSACPANYETVTGTFYGTQTYCDRYFGSYYLGTCTKKRGQGTTVYGLSDSTISTINSQVVCVKRDKVLTYHSMVTSRSNFCSTGTVCGSATDPNKQFCIPSTISCPLNGLMIEKTSVNYSSPTTTSTLQGGWTAYEIRNNQTNSPISALKLAINPPCGNLDDDYLRRTYMISSLYDANNGDCLYYNADGTHEHTLFYPTSLSDTELNVYG